ncbi:uncharacterized protein LOC117302700 [Asterias rubens]|uniref:uncharacterized protein LOC117302700 n=1 Tax=Asterias rubens TaxID=7604 RepID=UPI001455536D|nr:uncharacterized protein LOC117302700 [Asterias rubens]
MAALTDCKMSVIFLAMFLLGHHRVQTFKLNNDVLSFVDTDSSVETEHGSSRPDPSSYHSMEDDHNDYSDSEDDDHDNDDDHDDASSIQLSALQAESSVPDDDPDFVPSEIDLSNDSPSSSSDDHEPEDLDFVPSEIDLSNGSDAISHDYESEDPDFVPSETDLSNDSQSSSSDDHEPEDLDFVPSEIDLSNGSDAISHDYESEDPDFVPSETDLSNDSQSSSSDDHEPEDLDFVLSEIDLSNGSDAISHDYESEDPDFVPSETDLSNDSQSSSSDDHEPEDLDFVPSEIDLSNDSDAISHDYESEDPDFVPSEVDLSNDSPSSSSDDQESEDSVIAQSDLPVEQSKDSQETRGIGSSPSTQLREHDKDKTSRRRGKQWGGSPPTRRLNEIRQADAEYFDLYLCGQFLDITEDDSNRFAVLGFNYAGRSQPFLPCQDPSSVRETVNYLYRTQTDSLNAFQQVLRDLPAAWQRYIAEKGSAPRTVHIFSFNAPANVDDVVQFLQLRTSEPYSSARFILGYANQRVEIENGKSDLDGDFVDLMEQLRLAKVDAVLVCGRCLKVAGYPVGGRRRNTMRYGMSALPWPISSQCRIDQEDNIPGADFTQKTCNSFQKSVAKCAVRSLDRRLSRDDDTTRDAVSGRGTNEDLQRKLGEVTRICIRDKRCWRKESASIRDLFVSSEEVPGSHRRRGPKLDFGKIIERCVSGARKLPLDLEDFQRH